MIWPRHTESWVVPHPPEMVEAIMRLRVMHAGKQQLLDPDNQANYLFNGVVREESCNISRLITRPDSFLPLIEVRWVGTAQSSLLFITYRLFASTRMFMAFWSIVSFFAALVLFFMVNELAWGVMVCILMALTYWVCVANFKRNVKLDSKILREVLE
jgi:hypothetical protein